MGPSMSQAVAQFRGFLREEGLQLTPQREIILSEFLKAKEHLSVEELYDRIKKKHKTIGQVTVFRTLKLLVAARIAVPVSFGDKTVRYEPRYGVEHHDHLICEQCGKVIEVLDAKLEKIQDRLCDRHSFVPSRHRLEIFGTCSDCR